ncbi:hypothetical protein IMSAGC006_02152 [Muribaculaceae bacterium]|nr:hypothetical protein IMSAGC006_02152 [Muribaculaceae bacterium]
MAVGGFAADVAVVAVKAGEILNCRRLLTVDESGPAAFFREVEQRRCLAAVKVFESIAEIKGQPPVYNKSVLCLPTDV